MRQLVPGSSLAGALTLLQIMNVSLSHQFCFAGKGICIPFSHQSGQDSTYPACGCVGPATKRRQSMM
jgi:hypothetical protein